MQKHGFLKSLMSSSVKNNLLYCVNHDSVHNIYILFRLVYVHTAFSQ